MPEGWSTHQPLGLGGPLPVFSHSLSHTHACTHGHMHTGRDSLSQYSSCQGVPHGLGTRLMGWSWLSSIWLHTHTGVFCCYCLSQSMVVAPHMVLHSLHQSSPCRLPKPLHLRGGGGQTHTLHYVYHFLGKVTAHFVKLEYSYFSYLILCNQASTASIDKGSNQLMQAIGRINI